MNPSAFGLTHQTRSKTTMTVATTQHDLCLTSKTTARPFPDPSTPRPEAFGIGLLEARCPDVGRGHGRTTQALSPMSQVAAKTAKVMSLLELGERFFSILNVLDKLELVG